MSKARLGGGSGGRFVAPTVLSVSSAAEGAKTLEAPHALKRELVVLQGHRMKFPDLFKEDMNLTPKIP